MVYDSPVSLPGRYKWLTKDEDVRRIEKLLEMPAKTIGAPLWLSGDIKTYKKCRREVNWLDIVSSSLESVHSANLIAEVILGEQKFVNTEALHDIEGLKCHNCRTSFENLRSFKCHKTERTCRQITVWFYVQVRSRFGLEFPFLYPDPINVNLFFPPQLL